MSEANQVALLGILLVLAVCGLAIWKGRAPERLGGAAVLLTWVLAASAQLAFGTRQPILTIMIADGLLALAFLVLTLRFGSIWLGGAMLMQSAAFYLHATRLDDPTLHPDRYIQWVNLLSTSVLALVLVATLCAWGGRLTRERRWIFQRAVQPAAA